jgi:hypothetical protein
VSAVDIGTVSRVMETLLETEGRPILYHDRATGADLAITPMAASSPSGLLPALAVAGEAVWREATGKGFALDIVRDPEALLGYRLRGIGAGSLTTVMLAAMEATAQVTGSGVVVASDLNAVWSAATDRIEQSARSSPRNTTGAAP